MDPSGCTDMTMGHDPVIQRQGPRLTRRYFHRYLSILLKTHPFGISQWIGTHDPWVRGGREDDTPLFPGPISSSFQGPSQGSSTNGQGGRFFLHWLRLLRLRSTPSPFQARWAWLAWSSYNHSVRWPSAAWLRVCSVPIARW